MLVKVSREASVVLNPAEREAIQKSAIILRNIAEAWEQILGDDISTFDGNIVDIEREIYCTFEEMADALEAVFNGTE